MTSASDLLEVISPSVWTVIYPDLAGLAKRRRVALSLQDLQRTNARGCAASGVERRKKQKLAPASYDALRVVLLFVFLLTRR